MGFLGRPELWIIIAVALLIFGPKKLPEMGSSIGKTIREFQKSMREIKEPEQPNAAVTPTAATQAPAAQIAAPVSTTAPNAAAMVVSAEATQAPATVPTLTADVAAPAVSTPTADPLPPVGSTVE